MVLDDDHTGLYVSSKLIEAISKWSLTGKIHLGVRDNAANMICAMEKAGIADLGCLAHTMQLVLHDAVFTQSSVETVVKKARKVVTHFKHSEQANRHLEEYQLSRDVPKHALIQDVETRWNSTYLMLERLAEQRKAINLYSAERGSIDTLSTTEWDLVDRVVAILEPFYDATIELSSDDACVSVIIPLIAMLSAKMESAPEDRGLLQMKAALRDSMKRRIAYYRKLPSVIAATLLDPRFKDLYFRSEESKAAQDEILNFLRLRVTTASTGDASDSTSQISSDIL